MFCDLTRVALTFMMEDVHRVRRKSHVKHETSVVRSRRLNVSLAGTERHNVHVFLKCFQRAHLTSFAQVI
jgi:hypothetical protein